VDGDTSHYEVDIDLGNRNTSHSLVADLVGRGKRVLDVGCWTGDLGRVLVQRGCEVSGLEIDEEAAEKARADLETVVVADLEVAPTSQHFPGGSFDAVVFADVLEHLRDPVGVLRDAAGLLAPDGKIVISVPNVTHGSVRLALLQGRWRYTDTGLLDATHIRFFNRAGVMELLSSAGLVVDELRGSIADPLDVEVVVDSDRLPPTVIEWVRHQRDAMVYQFVVSAKVAPAGEVAEPTVDVPLVPAVPEESIRFRDKFTTRSEAELEARQQQLNYRDHILGLEAAAATAHSRVARAERQLRGAQKRLDRKNARIKELAAQVSRLQRQLDQQRPDGVRGALGRLRRGRDQ
jgi:2-polyprenyl-3-methyl-5-hydroxy-6-metoxy-1,4-benzoquinol methylase